MKPAYLSIFILHRGAGAIVIQLSFFCYKKKKTAGKTTCEIIKPISSVAYIGAYMYILKSMFTFLVSTGVNKSKIREKTQQTTFTSKRWHMLYICQGEKNSQLNPKTHLK